MSDPGKIRWSVVLSGIFIITLMLIVVEEWNDADSAVETSYKIPFVVILEDKHGEIK